MLYWGGGAGASRPYASTVASRQSASTGASRQDQRNWDQSATRDHSRPVTPTLTSIPIGQPILIGQPIQAITRVHPSTSNALLVDDDDHNLQATLKLSREVATLKVQSGNQKTKRPLHVQSRNQKTKRPLHVQSGNHSIMKEKQKDLNSWLRGEFLAISMIRHLV